MNIQGFTPAILSPVPGLTANSIAKAQSSSSSSGNSSSTSPSNLEGTFLNLLVTELQNQDPTSPVDPTQMVGQMVSLNQLDQLISINQVLKDMAATNSTSPALVQAQAAKAGTTNHPRTSMGAAAANSSGVAGLAASPQPVQYFGNGTNGGMMNLYGNIALPGATSNPILMGAK